MAKEKKIEKFLDELNQEQKMAVEYGNGPLLIIAGAGTGKTAVITERIGWLISKKLAQPEEILALTFTEKAAQEMEERVDRLLPYGYVDLWVLTFHSFCERILQNHAIDIGLPLNFKLLDQSQQYFLVQNNFDKFDLDYYRPLGNPTKFIQSLVKHFSRAKDEMINPFDYLKYAENFKADLDATMSGGTVDEETGRLQEIANAYHVYQQLLLENNALDFGDLINYTIQLFAKRPMILEKYRRQFKYILVDEFQDTNWAQYKLFQMLAEPANNITVVSDDDQSVYKFRGASYNNVIQFKKDYPQSKEIVLIENYRSGQEILDLAYNFIQLNNPERLEAQDKHIVKKLKARKGEKAKIEHLHFKTQQDEAQGVVEKIMEIKNKDHSAEWNDFAILVRANAQAEVFVQSLNLAGIPHQFMARSGLFAKPVIMDILAYLKLLDNYHESQAVYRILISPIFAGKIGNSELSKINYFANKKNWSLYEVMEKASLVPEISSMVIEQFNILLSWINKHTELTKTESVSKVIYAFLEDTGYLKILSRQSKNGGEGIFWLNQFFKKVENFEAINFDKSAGNFIKMVDIMISTGDTGSIETDLEEGPESVKVMTVHSAKGLEFKYVFIVNLVDRRFPTIERQEAIELPDGLVKEIVPKGDIHLQEERRLFYVAITRAKQELYLTSADDYGGKFAKKLSRFLYEVGLEKQIEIKQTKPIKNKTDKKLAVNKIKREIPPPSEFSFSQLISYDTCPWQYYYAYILRIPVRGHFTLSFGKSIHNTLNRFCSFWLEKNVVEQTDLFKSAKQKSGSKILSLSDLLGIYQEMWIDDWYESKEHRDKYKEKGRQLLKKFYDDFVKNLPEIKYLEKEFKFKLGNYTIKGAIDRVDKIGNYYEIIDYKTGEGGENKLDKEKKQQLLIYQLAAKFLPEVFDKQIQQLTFYYLEAGERVSFLGDESELEGTQEKIINTIKEINKGKFNPKPSRKCEWCDFKNICDFK